jgi:ABC-type lipoprotein release transport system permease subunit
MRTFLKMAWRNIWRNKRRSLITIASIVFSMLFALVMRSMQEGTYSLMIRSVVDSYTGFIQISGKDYRDDRTLEKSIEFSDDLKAILESNSNVSHYLPRMESFALASTGRHTKGVMVTGVDPLKEDAFTKLSGRVRNGNYFHNGDGGVLVASRLAKYLNLSVGDTLVLMGQGFQGVSAAGLFPVRAIVELPSIELDNSLVFMTIDDAQLYFDAPNRVTSIALDLHNAKQINETQSQLAQLLSPEMFVVERWDQILKELVQMIESDRISNQALLYILYIVIGFGVFGTLLMMATERRREFGMMMAVGMKRSRIASMLGLEILILNATSVLVGFVVSLPVLITLHLNPIRLTGEMADMMEAYGWEPIIPFSVEHGFMIEQLLVVSLLVIIAGIIPVVSTSRLKLQKALRG